MTTKLERLLEKEAQLKAQIQQAKALERTLEKKRDTRRKILIGAAVMAQVDNGKWPHDDLLSMMDGFLTRDNERELFGLDGGAGTDADQRGKKDRPVGLMQKAEAMPLSEGKKAAKKLSESSGNSDFDDFDL